MSQKSGTAPTNAALFAEAIGELRDHRSDAALRGSLSEQAGWTWLLELGDPERADREFLAAATANPTGIVFSTGSSPAAVRKPLMISLIGRGSLTK